MSRLRPSLLYLAARARRPALVATTGILWFMFTAVAQENGGLRGTAGTSPSNTALPPLYAPRTDPTAATEAESNAPPAQYQPISPGALPDDGALPDAEQDAFDAPLPGRQTATPVPAPRSAEDADAETTGAARVGTVDSLDEERNAAEQRDQQRTGAIETNIRQREENPFEATGIRAGSFILRPTLQQGLEWSSNPGGGAGGESDVLSETTLRLNAQSDWARHAATLDAYGTYRRSITGSDFKEFLGGADASVRFDLGNDFQLNGTLGYQRRPEDATSAVELPAAAIERPTSQTITGSLGLEKSLGKLRLGLTGSVDRNIYGDAELAGGGTLSQAERNQTLYALQLRTGYQISPALTPFIEAEFGRRAYDVRTDSNGYRRSADRYGLRVGTEFDRGEKLSGELSAGIISENFDDERLETLSAFTVDGRVDWSPRRGTTVSLNGTTEIEGTTTAGESGSVLYASTLSVSRELRANLTGLASLGLAWRRYAGSDERDLTWNAQTSLTWWLNRYAGVTGRLSYEKLDSTLAGRDSNSTSIFLGMTLQR